MLYDEYRVDFNGKRAIFNSRAREIVVIDLSTELVIEPIPEEQAGLLYCILKREKEELEGRVNKEVRTMEGAVSCAFIQWEGDIELGKLEYRIINLWRRYSLKDIDIKVPRKLPRREVVELTPIPEGTNYLSDGKFSQLISDWVKGRLAHTVIPYETEERL